jgi:putative ABC transport system ATP-binding protein
MNGTRAPSTEPIIELADVAFSWPGALRPVVAIPSLRVLPGERLLIRGASGSGKSTFISLLAGTVAAQYGSLRVLGQDMRRLTGGARDRFRADHIGVVFQLFNLLPFLSVRDNVSLPCRFSSRRRQRCEQHGATPRDEAATLLRHLDIVGEELLNRRAGELSVGQQQRVAVARALIGAPELVLADEPTSSLDVDRREAFLELLFAESARHRTTVILVTHDVTLARLFDRVIEFSDLNCVERGAVERNICPITS